MPLDTAGLKTALKAAYVARYTGTMDADQLTDIDQLCEDMAVALTTFVETATVTSAFVLANGAGDVSGTIINTVT